MVWCYLPKEIVVEVCADQQRLTGKFVIADIVNEQLPAITWQRMVAPIKS